MSAAVRPLKPLAPEIRELLLKLIRQADAPLTAKQCSAGLTGPFKATDKRLAPVLDELVADGSLRSFAPLLGKAPRYWDRSLNEYARKVMRDVLAERGPLKPADLKKQTLRFAKGLSDADYQQELCRLIAERRVFEHPPASSRSKQSTYHCAPPVPAPYLKSIADELRRMVALLLESGVSRDDLEQAGLELLRQAGLSAETGRVSSRDQRPMPVVDLIELMRFIEPGADRGALVTLPELRRAAGLNRNDFDESVLELARLGRVTLHRHDFPSNLAPAERDALVTDGHGNFYIGICLRLTDSPIS